MSGLHVGFGMLDLVRDLVGVFYVRVSSGLLYDGFFCCSVFFAVQELAELGIILLPDKQEAAGSSSSGSGSGGVAGAGVGASVGVGVGADVCGGVGPVSSPRRVDMSSRRNSPLGSPSKAMAEE